MSTASSLIAAIQDNPTWVLSRLEGITDSIDLGEAIMALVVIYDKAEAEFIAREEADEAADSSY